MASSSTQPFWGELHRKLRYGGAEFLWRARCPRMRTRFTIASWPWSAENATRRWEVLVRADGEVVGAMLPLRWAGSRPACVVSSRTGVTVDNVILIPKASTAAPGPREPGG